MAAPKGLNPVISFNTINEHYGLNYTLRQYKPDIYIRYQIVDSAGNPVTEYIIAKEMRTFLKGLGHGLSLTKK